MKRALWALCALLSASVWAQDPAPAKPSPQAPAASKETPSKETPNKQTAGKEAAKPAASSDKPAAAKGLPADADAKQPAKDASSTPQRFIPSEQVRSDFDVSFPVDI